MVPHVMFGGSYGHLEGITVMVHLAIEISKSEPDLDTIWGRLVIV